MRTTATPMDFVSTTNFLVPNKARATVNSQAMNNEVACNWRLVGQAFVTWKRLINERSFARNAAHYARYEQLSTLSARAWRRYSRRCSNAISRPESN